MSNTPTEMTGLDRKGVHGILKTLLYEGEISKNQIEKHTPEKVSHGQVLELVSLLEENSLISIRQGKRGAQMCNLTPKGVVYLAFKVSLTDQDFEKVARRFLAKYPTVFQGSLSGLLLNKSIGSYRSLFEKLKHNVNLEFYDNEQAVQTFLENLLDQAILQIPETAQRLKGRITEKEISALKKDFRRDKEDIKIFVSFLEHLKHQKRLVERRIWFIEKMLNLHTGEKEVRK